MTQPHNEFLRELTTRILTSYPGNLFFKTGLLSHYWRQVYQTEAFWSLHLSNQDCQHRQYYFNDLLVATVRGSHLALFNRLITLLQKGSNKLGLMFKRRFVNDLVTIAEKNGDHELHQLINSMKSDAAAGQDEPGWILTMTTEVFASGRAGRANRPFFIPRQVGKVESILAKNKLGRPTRRVPEFRICPTYMMVYCTCWFGRAGVKIFN